MYGDEDDEDSGGHLQGTGRPGKTEFPAHWDEERIAHEVRSVADDPDMATELFDGTWRVAGAREGVTVRVYVRGDGSIATAAPAPGPGIKQNPRAGGA
ncbi:MAG: EndoU domain-containing protein [Micromonosporaceae bacterium]